MTGQVHWLPLATLLFAALLVAFLWIRSRRLHRNYKVEHSQVRCRARGNQLVECTVVRDASSGVPIGIQTCSAQPGGVCSDKSCLPLFVRAA